MFQSIATTRTKKPHQTIQEGFIDDTLIEQQYDKTSSNNRYLKTGIQPKINQLIELTINTNNTQQTISTITNSSIQSTQQSLHVTGKIISISSYNNNNLRPSTSLSDVGPSKGSLVLADAIHYLSKELSQPPTPTANGQQSRRGSAQSLDRSTHSLDDDGGILLLDTSNYSLGSFDSLNNGVGGICPNDTLPSKWTNLSNERKEIIINSIVDRMGCLHGQEIICEGKFVSRLNNGGVVGDLNTAEDLYRFILVADDSYSENMWRLDVSRLVNLSTRRQGILNGGDTKKIDAIAAQQQENNDMITEETITLQKIIGLGNLSEITWKVEDSDTTLGDVGVLINNANNNGNDDTKLQHLYNGTKFSLLVAKLYTQFCNDIGPTQLTLDNFEVQVLRHNEAADEERTITIFGMEIIQPTINEEDEEPPKDMLQNLGQLIHAIFSSGISSTSTSSQPHQGASAIRGENGEDENVSTRQKAMRSSSKAFFSFDQLLESNQYPISICRLLSDMIDKSSESCNPIQSFDEVIDELEQMVLNPQTYLYDPESTFHSSKLHFGQGFYGRKAEMERILEIALRGDNTGLEAVLVSGPAGCGKTHLVVSNLGSMLEASGWLGCSTAKFERGEESKAKEIMAAAYEKIVADLVDMRSSTNESDVDYSRRATEAILTSFDVESLSYMADIAPSIQRLIPGTGRVSYLLINYFHFSFI